MEPVQRTTRETRTLPPIMQGGMGISVSNWKLARAVARLGHYGVVSGTAIDSVVVRELQLGDPHGRRRALAAYPDQEIAEYLVDQFYVEGGIEPGAPFRLLPIHRFDPTIRSQRILSAATFTEVFLAKEGHDGLVGINFLAKIKRHTLAGMYGAMLAGVNAVMMGAGIPIEEAEALSALAEGRPASLRLEVDSSAAPEGTGPFTYTLDPANLIERLEPLPCPAFFPIISSDLLANILFKKLPSGTIAGWIIEGAVAGGHNAPPRNKGVDENQNPVYDERDTPDLERVRKLGLPFYLAGGYGSPEGLRRAQQLGATGVQVGTLFSLAAESGYPQEEKSWLIEQVHRGTLSVRTDGRISSTGFPFKVVEAPGTLGDPEVLAERTRICDLGYLQTAYVDEKGRVQGRCPAEPVETYVSKGGRREDTERRACLCNALLANIGLGNHQKWGPELALFTAGDDLTALPLGSAEHPRYSASDVVEYLLR